MDLSEKGRRDDGTPISLDRRLFMKFTAFGDAEPEAAQAALAEARVEGAMYLDAHDADGIGIAILSEDPSYFVTELRALYRRPPFCTMTHKAEFDMLGRTYAIGYEADLQETLFGRPRGRILDRELRWAVWYPLQRSKEFYRLPAERQRRILAEHGGVGRRYGEAGLAADVRLACHGLDQHDNDFVIGLLGRDLHPLSAVVQEMRATEQTAQYLDRLGPFFVGHKAWQSAASQR